MDCQLYNSHKLNVTVERTISATDLLASISKTSLMMAHETADRLLPLAHRELSQCDCGYMVQHVAFEPDSMYRMLYSVAKTPIVRDCVVDNMAALNVNNSCSLRNISMKRLHASYVRSHPLFVVFDELVNDQVEVVQVDPSLWTRTTRFSILPELYTSQRMLGFIAQGTESKYCAYGMIKRSAFAEENLFFYDKNWTYSNRMAPKFHNSIYYTIDGLASPFDSLAGRKIDSQCSLPITYIMRHSYGAKYFRSSSNVCSCKFLCVCVACKDSMLCACVCPYVTLDVQRVARLRHFLLLDYHSALDIMWGEEPKFVEFLNKTVDLQQFCVRGTHILAETKEYDTAWCCGNKNIVIHTRYGEFRLVYCSCHDAFFQHLRARSLVKKQEYDRRQRMSRPAEQQGLMSIEHQLTLSPNLMETLEKVCAGVEVSLIREVVSILCKVIACANAEWNIGVVLPIVMDFVVTHVSNATMANIEQLFMRIFHVETVPVQHGFEQIGSLETGVATTIMLLIYVMMYKSMPKDSVVNDFITFACKASTPVYCFNSMGREAFTMMQTIVGWIKEKVYGSDVVFNTYVGRKQVLASWFEDVRVCLQPESLEKIRVDRVFKDFVINTYERGLDLAKLIGRTDAPREVVTAFTMSYSSLRVVYNYAQRSGAPMTKPKNEPVIVRFVGGTACGKSTLIYPLTIDVLKNYDEKEWKARDGRWRECVYFRTVGQKWWDSYANQPVCVYDDFSQLRDTENNPSEELMEIIRIGNNATMPLPMASVEEKGNMYFSSKLIILTANQSHFLTPSIHEPRAVMRRMDLNYVVMIKPEYTHLVGDTAMLDVNKLPDTALCMDIYQFQKLNPITHEMYGELYSYEEVVQQIGTLYASRLDRNDLLFQELDRRAETQGLFSNPYNYISQACDKVLRTENKEAVSTKDTATVYHGSMENNEDCEEHYTVWAQMINTLKQYLPSKRYCNVSQMEREYEIIGMESCNNGCNELPCTSAQALQRDALTANGALQISQNLSDLKVKYEEMYSAYVEAMKRETTTIAYWLDQWVSERITHIVKIFGTLGILGSLFYLGSKVRNATRKSSQPKSVVTQATGVETQGLSQNTAELLVHVAAPNTWVMQLEHEGSVLYSTMMTFLYGTTAVTCAHALDRLFQLNTPHTEIVLHNAFRQQFVYRIKSDQIEIKRRLKDRDLILFSVRSINSFHDIRKHLPRRGNLASPIKVVLVSCAFGQDGSFAAFTTSPTYGESISTQEVKTHDGSMLTYTNLTSYEIPTTKGMCGSPIIVSDNYKTYTFQGFHVAGNGEAGFCQPVYKEDLMNFPEDKSTIVQDLEHFDRSDVNMPEGNFYPIGTYPTGGDNYKSQYKRSVVFDKIAQHRKVPALLSREAAYLGLAKTSNSLPALNKRTFEESLIDIDVLISGNKKMVRTIDMKTAVFGIKGHPWIRSMDVSTSSGLPWVLNSKKSTKKQYINLDEEWIAPELCDAVIERIDRASQNEMVLTVWKDTKKDELRLKEKVLAKKTRMFAAAPVDYVIAVRMYFLTFMSHVMSNKIQNEVAVGINPTSADWHILHAKLTQFGNTVIAGDFKSFDGTLHPIVFDCILELICKWYNNEKDNKVRRVLFQDIMFSKHAIENVLYQWTHGFPSGNPMTSVINSLYNIAVTHAAYYSVCDEPWSENCYMIAYGDDNVIAISESKREVFNGGVLSAFMRNIGMEYTDAQKSGEPAFLDISEIEFLKRKFRFNADLGHYVGVLSEVTYLETTNWIKRSADDVAQLHQNMCTCAWEAAWESREQYDKIVELCNAACDSVNIKHPRYKAYYSCLEEPPDWE